jgi:hypothetical protein
LYTAPLTVPNLIVPPLTDPVMPVVSGGSESWICPFSFDPDSVQFRVKLPAKAPL